MKWATDELKIFGIYLLIIVAGVIIYSIKEREKIIPNLVEFFVEWWGVIKKVSIFLIIIFILLLSISI